MAAHDLRSPLAVISMYAELVTDELEEGTIQPAAAAERLQRIRRAADRGVALIEDLLAYASIGSESLEIGPVDLTLLTRAVAAEQQAAADREVQVCVHDLPEVEGSLPLLRQLVSNLVANAVKYSPADRQARIDVDSAPGHSSDWVTVRVTDNGDPIAEGDRGAVVRDVPARRPQRRARLRRRPGDLPAGGRGARRPGLARPGLHRRQPVLHRARRSAD